MKDYPKRKLTSEEKKQQRMQNILQKLMDNQGKFIHLVNYTLTSKQCQRLKEEISDILTIMGVSFEIKAGTSKIRVLTQDQINKRMPFSQRYGYKSCPIDYSTTSRF